jgi:hypothetical protein
MTKEIKEEKDESFEIISIKEKYWRDQLAEAESNLFKSEGNVKVSKKVIRIAEEEIKKEAEKNAH